MPTLEEQIQEMIATGRFSPQEGGEMRQYAQKRLAAQPAPSTPGDMATAMRGGAPTGDLYKGARAGAESLAPTDQPGLMSRMAGPLGQYNPIEAKAKTRAMSAMKKRRFQEEMTGEPQPGLGYEETLTQERIKVEREVADEKARQGMTIGDVLSGKAPPKVGGEFVFPPGDVSQSPAFQAAKAEADAATEGQVVAEIPDDEVLGGKNPKDTPPPSVGQERKYDEVEKPGDFRRNAAQRKLDQLSNLRSIAEGGMRFGNLAVAGDYVPGQTPRAGLTQQPRAEGIRGEIARITGEEDLYLKSQLKREEQQDLYGLRADEERVKAELERLGIPHNMTTWQATEMLKERKDWLGGDTHTKANQAFAAVRAGLESLKEVDGKPPTGQAQMLAARQVLKAYGEGSRMSDYDLQSIIYSPQFKGMYDRIYRFLTGRATPQTVELYRDMLQRLDKATKEHFKNVKQRRAEGFNKSTGIPTSVILENYGTLFDEGDMPKAAPKGNQIRVTKDGEEQWIMESDEEAWRRRGWNRGA